MTDKTYNGWTNYATWRVMLECFDGNSDQYEGYTAETCEDIIMEYMEEQANGLALDYATAFLSDVNWQEISEALERNFKEDQEIE